MKYLEKDAFIPYNDMYVADLSTKVGESGVFHIFNRVFPNPSSAFHKIDNIPRKDGETMFLGQYIHTVDAKGRTFIPAKYRTELGESFIVTRSTSGCLAVYPMSEWEKYTAKIADLPQAQALRLRRFIFSNAIDVTPDAQGRIGLAAGLREYAGIEKNIVIIGLGNYIEIWSEEAWKTEQESESGKEIEDIMLALGF